MKPAPSDPQFPYYRSPIAVEGTITDDSGPQDLAVAVNGLAGEVQNGHFTAFVSAPDGPLTLTAIGFDGVGNHGPSAPVSVVVDSTPPVITITPPVPSLTRQGSIVLAGSVADNSPVTVAIDGLNVPVTNGSFSKQVSLASGANTFVVTARDAALNDAEPKTVAVTRDSDPPRLTINHPNTAVVYTSSVAADGEVEDDSDVTVTLDGESASIAGIVWNRLVSGLPEGPHDFVAYAIDGAQNDTTVTRSVVVDLNAPVVQITSPRPAFTTTANIVLAGTVHDWSLQTLTVGGTATPFNGEPPSHPFSAPFTLVENENHIEVAATDGANRRATQSVDIVLDTTPPELSPIQAPNTLAPGTSASASVQVNERYLDRVVWTIPGMAATTQTQPPFAIDLTVSPGLNPGETFTVAVEAFDKVGHHASISKTIRVAASGVVTGQVLSDDTGQPLAGATARLVSGAAGTSTSDARGRYSLPTGAASAVLVVEKEGYTTVERTIAITPATGTVPVDARLTKLSTVPPDSDILTSGPLTLSSLASTARITRLSAQGLPNLLPMGWSPLAAFDLRGEGASAVQAAVNVAREHVAAVHLVEYRPATHAWHLTVADVANDAARPLSGAGVFAFVAPDTAALQPPPIGEALEGVDMVLLPADATSQGSVTPATLPPAGGIARGRVVVGTSTPVPAGTVIQAQVSETYTLADGREASEEPRRMDIVLFHEPASSQAGLTADFPIQPTRSYETGQLRGRRVHLDLLAGREGVRGVIGGNEPVTATLDGIQLTIPAAALTHDVAFGIGTSGISSFVPQSANLTALDEVSIDFSGETLDAPAELSIDGTNLSPDSTYLVARVDRFDGVPYMVVVAKGELQGGRLVARAGGGLPGIRTEGRFVFYRTSVPMGFIAGSIANAAGTPLIVSTSVGAFPFAALVQGSSYLLPAVDGPAALDARVPGTALHGSGSTTVVANETDTLNLTLVGTATHATITPLDGAVNFPAEGVIEISANERLRADSITAANIQLHDITVTASPTPISLRFVVSGNGRVVSVIPTSPALKPKTPYRLTIAGIVDVFGQAVQIPATVTFTTREETAPEFDAEALTLSFPDAQGLVHVKLPADKLPSGTQILVINMTTAFVAGFSIVGGVALDDTIPATLNDRLLITITRPDGNVTTFTKSTFIGPNGETAVNAGGGTVHAKDDPRYEIRIPEGALEKGVIFESEVYTPEPGDPLPDIANSEDFPDAVTNFGAGLRWKVSDPNVEFKKEVDLAYPVPPLPQAAIDKGYTQANAFFYVFRRMKVGENQDGSPQYAFRAIDEAHIEGADDDARVVTKSPPFQGVRDAYTTIKTSTGSPLVFLAAEAAESVIDMIASSYDVDPGKAICVGITGTVLRPEYETTTDPNTKQTTTRLVNKGVPGARVFLDPRPEIPDTEFSDHSWAAEGLPIWKAAFPEGATVSGPDGRFAFWLFRRIAGTYNLRAFAGNASVRGKLVQVTPADALVLGLGTRYRQAFSTSLTLPALPLQTPPSDVAMSVFKKTDAGKREALTSGFILKDTNLIVGVKIKNEGDELRSIEVVRDSGTESLALQPEYLPKEDPLAQKFVAELKADTAGTYRITATVLNPDNQAIPVSQTFRVIAAGNGSFTRDPQNAPQVVTSSVVPKVKTPAVSGVPVTVTPQLTFTEPVKNVINATTIQLVKVDGNNETPVSFKLTAVAVDTNDDPYIIPELNDSTARVSSLTLTPLAALEYGVMYKLRATADIVDLDTPQENGPRALVPFEMTFTTFKPEALTEPGGGVGSPGLVVLRDRAYLAEPIFRPVSTYLHVFDVSDPTSPTEIGFAGAAAAQGRPLDLAGEVDKDGLVVSADGRYLVVATAALGASRPSNLMIYDVSADTVIPLGGATLGSSVSEGTIWRLIVKEGTAYASMLRKGIQVVDLGGIVANFPKAPLSSTDPAGIPYFETIRNLNTDGRGWGQEYVSTIPVKVLSTANQEIDYTVSDLEVGDFVVGGSPQKLILAVGGIYNAAQHRPLLTINRLDVQNIQRFEIKKSVPDPANPGQQREVRIDFGGSIELTQLRDTRVAVVTGSETPSGAARLAVVSLEDASNPQTLAILEGVGGYLLVRDGKAYISAISYTEVYDLMPALDGQPPTYLGRIDGVGGTIAFNEEGSLLFGSSRLTFGRVGNGAEVDKYAGVKTAALEQVAIITKITPRRVVVDKDKHAAEAFEVAFKLIPSDDEPQTARLELRSGEATYAQHDVDLTNGTGSHTLSIGTNLSPLLPEVRIVARPGAEREVIGFPKRVEAARVQVGPNESVQVSADDAALPVVGYSDAHLGRFLDSLAQRTFAATPLFTWEVLGSGASIAPNASLMTAGVSEVSLRTGTRAGEIYRLQARLPNSGVLGTSADIEVVAGRAGDLSLTTEKPALPADEASETTLTLVARDKFGNLVQDGTSVSWTVDGKGIVEPAQSLTVAGQASAKYRAGDVAGETFVVAAVDDVAERVRIDLASIEVSVLPALSQIAADPTAPIPVTITASSSAGPPADSASLFVRATLGRIAAPSTLLGGQATATFTPLGYPGQARLFASVGTQPGEATIDVVRPTGFFAAPEQRGFVGNRTADGTVTGEDLDGLSTTYSYRASTNLVITGTPGDEVRVRLGGIAAPNVEAIALYPMDDPLVDGTVVDEYHDHSGTASETGVTTDLHEKSTGAASLHFDGTGRVDVQDHAALSLTAELGVALDFRAEASQAATLLTKAGAYGLALVPDDGVRVRAFVTTASGEQAILSAPVPLGAWHSVKAFLRGGSLVLNVDGISTSLPISEPVDLAMGAMSLGEGLVGNLDNVRVYDFTRPKLMAFEDGSDTTTVTIGEGGEVKVKVRSLGNLRNHSPNATFVEWVADNIRQDYLGPKSGLLWTWTIELLVSVFLATAGAVTGDPSSVEAFAGDMISSFFLVGDIRDLLISLYRHAVGTATTGDYFVLVLAIIGIAATVTIVGDFFVTSLKNAAKILKRIPDPVQRLFGLYAKELIGLFLHGGGRQALNEFVTFLQALTKTGVAEAFVKIAQGIKEAAQVRRLVQLVAKAPDAAAYLLALGRAYDVLAASSKVGAKASKYVVDIIDVVGHHFDEAAKLGKQVTSWSQDAIIGVARYLEATDGSVADAMKIAGDFLQHFSGNLKAAEEFFTYLGKVLPRIEDVGKLGLKEFLTKPAKVLTDLKGSYLVLRLTAEAPELAGATIRSIFDRVKHGRNLVEGIDLDVLSKVGIREFWEIKFYKNFSQAVKAEQIKKHLATKIVPLFREIAQKTPDPTLIAQEMAKVKLKFNFVVETGGSLVDRKLLLETVQFLLKEDFDELVQAGFKFDLDDIIVRQGNPLNLLNWILPTPLLH